MTPHNLFHTDPLTASWLLAISALLVALVAVPLLRAALAGFIYAFAAVTGRRHLRATAARVMPRVAHLIGGLVIGTAAVAAPAMAATDARNAIASIDLDRDAGASRADVVTDGTDPGTTGSRTAAASTTKAPAPEHRAVQEAPATEDTQSVYIVRTGDTLWDIAAEHMAEPTNAEITEAWKAIWRANRAVIGDEPGLIHPGQQLDLGSLA